MRFYWFTIVIVMAGLVSLAGMQIANAADTKYILREERPVGSLQRVQVEIQTEGNLKLNASGKQVTQLPLKVDATLAYDERALTPGPKQSLRRVRHYQEAKANIRVGNDKQQSRLRDEAQLIVVQAQDDDVTLVSPNDPLAREELELIDAPANSAVLAGLLPTTAVKEGDTWQPANSALTQLLNIEVVLKNEAKATLKNVEDDAAKFELSGKVDGSIGGVATHFELAAKYTFDLKQKQITWFAVSLKEVRAIGHAEPGYDITSQIKVLVAPLSESELLSDKMVAALPKEVDAGHGLLRFESAKAGYRLYHDRRWRMMTDRPDLVVFRLVDRGDLVAQCNITKLSRQPKDKFLALETYQQDVKRALGKNVEQLVDASASTSSNGLRVLRITAIGKVAELPIEWIYYHITADDGRCVSCVLTLEQKLIERFGAADQSLLGALEFLPEEEQKAAEAPATSERR